MYITLCHTTHATQGPCVAWRRRRTKSTQATAQRPQRTQLTCMTDASDDWLNVNKSPAVARVSRPYSWHTLAACVHNCPIMIFRTRCCLRPKCKSSSLLMHITFNITYKTSATSPKYFRCKLWPKRCKWLILTAYRNLPTPYPTVPSTTPYDVPFSHSTKRYRQTDGRQSV